MSLPAAFFSRKMCLLERNGLSGSSRHRQRRDGRVAEGAGLLNRYTVKSRIGGSNPPLSAIFYKGILTVTHKGTHKLQSR